MIGLGVNVANPSRLHGREVMSTRADYEQR